MTTPFHIVIPARLESSRLPRKLLADLAGRSVIHRTWEQAMGAGAVGVTVATDSEEIAEAAQGFGADVVMTARTHTSGTDRIAEVAHHKEWGDETVVVNVQGDEPMMPRELPGVAAAALAADPNADIGTLCAPIESVADRDDPAVVKVVCDQDRFALYFSRSPIPHDRDGVGDLADTPWFRHLGIYAYRVGALRKLASLPPAETERLESLEQLRALHFGLRIRVAVCDVEVPADINTADDLRRVRAGLEGA